MGRLSTRGWLEDLQRLLRNLLNLAGVRVELAATELAEEIHAVKAALINGVLLVVLAFLAMFFAAAAAIAAMPERWRALGCLGIAVAFVAAILIRLAVLRRRAAARGPLFAATRAEIKADLNTLRGSHDVAG
jgi:uncharacterized membrane protein YqjE